MSDIADLIINGVICDICYWPLNEAMGFPSTCAECIDDGIALNNMSSRGKPMKLNDSETLEALAEDRIDGIRDEGGEYE